MKTILQVLDRNGFPVVVNQVGGAADSSFWYSIPAGGAFHFQTDGLPANIKTGWVKLTPDYGKPTPISSGLFSYNPENVMVSESGIPATNATTHARVYVDLSTNHNTGLAIANVSPNCASISIRTYQTDGTTQAGTSQDRLLLVAGGCDSKFADQFVSGLPVGFTGVLDMTSSTPFAALALRSLMNERNDFLMTTFPVADADKPVPSPVIFPQIADGGGYAAEFILISAGQAASTTLNYYDENGVPTEF